MLIVIGIGGSNLGTLAVHELINGKLYNDKSNNLKVYFADTVDSDYISTIMNLMEKELKLSANVILYVVSKSGTTIETLANFELFLNILKKYKKDSFKDYIVISSSKNSPLWDYAEKINCDVLEIPKNVGGRFSVFTSVSLFPLAMLKIDIKKLLLGAKNVLNNCFDKSLKNIPAINAAIIYCHYGNGKNILDTFFFGIDFESLGKWYRQLIGESISKEKDLLNKNVNVGITPTISIGSNDLHSVLQLYLSGPNDKFTTFVTVKNNFKKLEVKKNNINFSKIMNIISKSTFLAYSKQQKPFVNLQFNHKDEFEIGAFLQIKMLEIIYLACLFNIDPFNQPNVDQFKVDIKKYLKHI